MKAPEKAVRAAAAALFEYNHPYAWEVADPDLQDDYLADMRRVLEAAIPFLPCCKGCPDCKGIIGETGIL